MVERLRPAATLSLVCYTVGLPVGFLCILAKHRRSIFKDQSMRVAGQGDTEATNPYFHIRTRYQELYRYLTRTCHGSRHKLSHSDAHVAPYGTESRCTVSMRHAATRLGFRSMGA